MLMTKASGSTNRTIKRMTSVAFHIFSALALVTPATADAQSSAPMGVMPRGHAMAMKTTPRATRTGSCPRFAPATQLVDPPSLSSVNGTLAVVFSFRTDADAQGNPLYCFVTPKGMQDPTLHVSPGDTLSVTVTNDTPVGTPMMSLTPPNCGATEMTSSSVNLHFHGTNTSPTCHGDEVIKTLINPGETFTYTLSFPNDEPPGMYWYHPHVHGISDPIVMGGATGALIVDGIETIQPAVAGLTQHTLVLRDQAALEGSKEGPGNCGTGVPFRDVTVNYVPTVYPLSQKIVAPLPAPLVVAPGQAQFWRVGNTAADTILDLQLVYDGAVQPLNLVAIDGVPVNSQDGTAPGTMIPVTHFRLPPAARVEFIATTPPVGVKSARLITTNINTGVQGDCDPTRPLVQLVNTVAAKPMLMASPARLLKAGQTGLRFKGLRTAAVTTQRTVYFYEDANGMYMTVSGQPNRVYNPDNPPSIITTQGAVEEWTVQNQSTENHEFHIHQIHFLVESQNDFGAGHPQAPAITGQYLDTIEVPAWDGVQGHAFPSVTLKMDFRGAVVGSFVFHCHILEHEDQGMMAVIQVNPATKRKS